MFKTPQNKGSTCQVFGGKPPSRVTVIGTGFGFQLRRFSKFSHSSVSSSCADTVAFCLHVVDQRLWHWSKQSPINAWTAQRGNSFYVDLSDIDPISSYQRPLSEVIDGVMFLDVCTKVVHRDPQRFRYSGTQASRYECLVAYSSWPIFIAKYLDSNLHFSVHFSLL